MAREPKASRNFARRHIIYHIKVDWETHQLFMKYRDKLSLVMAGLDLTEVD